MVTAGFCRDTFFYPVDSGMQGVFAVDAGDVTDGQGADTVTDHQLLPHSEAFHCHRMAAFGTIQRESGAGFSTHIG